jgi:hypothetical protein
MRRDSRGTVAHHGRKKGGSDEQQVVMAAYPVTGCGHSEGEFYSPRLEAEV